MGKHDDRTGKRNQYGTTTAHSRAIDVSLVDSLDIRHCDKGIYKAVWDVCTAAVCAGKLVQAGWHIW